MIITQPPQIPPGTFVNNSEGQPLAVEGNKFDLTAAVAVNTWLTIRIAQWAALSIIPTDADWLELRIMSAMRASAASRSNQQVTARRTGSANLTGFTPLVMAHFMPNPTNTNTELLLNHAKVPLNPSSGVVEFDLKYAQFNVNPSTVIECNVKGWGRNP